MGLLLALFIASAYADAPDWARDQTLQRVGNTLRVVCQGSALSVDLARDQANLSCQSEAIRQVQTSVTVRSESVETEHDVVLHQEIRSNAHYAGLTCQPERESIVTDGDLMRVYLRCSYDLAKVRVTKSEEKEPDPILARHADVISDDVPKVNRAREQIVKHSTAYHVMVSSVPGPCDSIIINGRRSARALKCTENPQIVLIDALDDKELVVRPKNKGLMPKKIQLKGKIPATFEVQYADQ